MMRKKAILDASSAIILCKVQLSDLLVEVYDILMPSSVYAEITVAGHPEAAEYKKLAEDKIIQIVEVERQESFNAVNLDQGEYDCVQLFHQRAGDFLITDDGQAARYCKRESIPFINALLFPVVLKDSQIRDTEFCLEALRKIEKVGRYSEKVIAFAHSCSREDVLFAFP